MSEIPIPPPEGSEPPFAPSLTPTAEIAPIAGVLSEIIPPSDVEGPIEETVPALLGLRRYIRTVQLAWTNESLDSKDAHDFVIRRTPLGALRIRGFRATPENPDDAPITLSERATSLHRQGQGRRLEAKRREKWRLEQSLGKPGPDERPVASSRVVTSRKLENNPRVVTVPRTGYRQDAFELDEEERMRPSLRRATKSAARHDKRLVNSMSRKTNRLLQAEAGETLPGKIRTRKLEKLDDRRRHLETRIDEL